MNKKGFTLIEILAIIILLGLISLITVPAVRKMIQSSKQKLYDEQINLIEAGLKNWANANIFLLPEGNETIKLSLGQLKQAGYIETKISNPKNNKCISNESILNITRYNNNYIYKVEEAIDVDCDLIEGSPIIKLNGEAIEYLYIGDTYVDKGSTAKDSGGNDITDYITTTIAGSGTNIDTSKVGNYTVTYKVVADGKTATVIKNIFVTYKYKNGIMSSMNNCINSGTCEPGTLVNVKVNAKEDYNFYVISDALKKLTLIMDRNLGNDVEWIDENDYTSENNKDETPDTCNYTSCTDEGPITAINYLDILTDEEWSNIPKRAYTYSGLAENGTTRVYEDIVMTMRARMLTYDEATKILGCTMYNNSCPSWLYKNLNGTGDNNTDGYWTSIAYLSHSNYAWRIRLVGSSYYATISEDFHTGIRPVIELSK